MRRAPVLLVALLPCGVALLGGCSHTLYSPPVRGVPLDTPAVLDPGQASGGLGGSYHGALFGPDVASGTVHGRVGLAPDLEGAAEVRLSHVLGDSSSRAFRGIGSGRLALKWNPPHLERYLAVTGGAGGGGSAAGGFLGADLGLVLGFENPYVVPILALQLHGSLPVGARTVDISDPDEPPGSRLDHPRLTYGHELTLGLKVRLQPRRWLRSPALTAGYSFLTLYTRDAAGERQHETFSALGLQLEVPL
jgi:hypothetical protein